MRHMRPNCATPRVMPRISSVFLYFRLHIHARPTAAQRLIKQHRVGQNQLVVSEQVLLRFQQGPFSFEDFQLRHHAEAQLRLNLIGDDL